MVEGNGASALQVKHTDISNKNKCRVGRDIIGRRGAEYRGITRIFHRQAG